MSNQSGGYPERIRILEEFVCKAIPVANIKGVQQNQPSETKQESTDENNLKDEQIEGDGEDKSQ